MEELNLSKKYKIHVECIMDFCNIIKVHGHHFNGHRKKEVDGEFDNIRNSILKITEIIEEDYLKNKK